MVIRDTLFIIFFCGGDVSDDKFANSIAVSGNDVYVA